MPQIGKTDRKDLSFSVSPWQSKRGSTQIATDQAYTEVQVPIKKPKTEASFPPQVAAATARKDVHSHGWRTRNSGGITSEISPHTQPKVEDASNSTSPAPELIEHEVDYSEPDEDLGTSLVGTAVLALLPNGQISGHLLDAHSSKCFGIMGRQLTAERECTRDFEWKLLYVTIIDFKTNKEVSFPAERTAADAATIQAPLQMHGKEQQIIEALHGHPNTDVSLKFQCTTIMVSLLPIIYDVLKRACQQTHCFACMLTPAASHCQYCSDWIADRGSSREAPADAQS